MHEGKAKGAELIIFEDGTLYHIDLKHADNIPPNLFFVGAAERVDAIAAKFDAVSFRHRNRARPEFYIASGAYKSVPMAAMSCGIGPDNIEIVLNELHALFEYDHKENRWSKTPAPVNIIRVGTCGAARTEIPVGALAVTRYALGLDNLGAYYPSPRQDPTAALIEAAFHKTRLGAINPLSYAVPATPAVAEILQRTAGELGERHPMIASGITIAAPGFFGPEGRSIGRIKTTLTSEEFYADVVSFEAGGHRIVNFEMETGILFRIAHEILDYNAGAICLVLDNLSTDEIVEASFAAKRIDACITIALETMVKLVKTTGASA